MFNGTPEVRLFMEFLATWESGESWAEAGRTLFPYLNQDLSVYPNEIDRSLDTALIDAEVFRFDGSDLMPEEVGAGSFWKGMVDWVNGTTLDDVLTTIQDSWPK